MPGMRKGARLGQHFLKAPWAARALACAIPLREDEVILEIGPGKGALTRELLLTGRKVIAIEKDEELVENLHEKFAEEIDSGMLKILSADIRDIEPEKLQLVSGKYMVAANIPYYITGEIIRQFLTAEAQPRAMALLVQKEVAKRIVSQRESILSLSVKAFGTPHIVKNVPRRNFSPPPNVDSAILAITDISRDFFSNPVRSDASNGAGVDEEMFFRAVRTGFASKRKFLANNLAVFGKENAVSAMSSCAIPEKSRAENVPLPKWKCLAHELGIRQVGN